MRRRIFTLLSAVSLVLCGWLIYRWVMPDDAVLFIADRRVVIHLGPLRVLAGPQESAVNLFNYSSDVRHWRIGRIEYACDEWGPQSTRGSPSRSSISLSLRECYR